MMLTQITDYDWPDSRLEYTGRWDVPERHHLLVTEDNLRFLADKLNDIIAAIEELREITGE